MNYQTYLMPGLNWFQRRLVYTMIELTEEVGEFREKGEVVQELEMILLNCTDTKRRTLTEVDRELLSLSYRLTYSQSPAGVHASTLLRSNVLSRKETLH